MGLQTLPSSEISQPALRGLSELSRCEDATVAWRKKSFW
jgi:hypothetical protein